MRSVDVVDVVEYVADSEGRLDARARSGERGDGVRYGGGSGFDGRRGAER